MAKRYLITIFITLCAASVVFGIHDEAPLLNPKLFDFPEKVGKWEGRTVPMENWVYDSLETRFAILRDYYAQGSNVINLAIVWYDDKDVAFHAPEACLGGYGNTVKESSSLKVQQQGSKELNVGRFSVERGGRNYLVLYYFINDDFITHDQVQLRKRILLRKLGFQRTSAAFVRLMMLVDDDIEKAEEMLTRFFNETLPIVRKYTATSLAMRGASTNDRAGKKEKP